MRRTWFLVVLLTFAYSGIVKCEEEPPRSDAKKNKIGVSDIITGPVEMVLAPVFGKETSKSMVAPAEALLLPVFDASRIVSTPGRTPEYTTNINKNVTVITSEEMELSAARSVQDVLFRKAGININGYMGNSKDNNVDMMGFGETGLLNYEVLIDGRRMNQIDMSGADLSQVDIASIDRIEIVKGANSVLYGDNASGGVVNIITKRGKMGHRIKYAQALGSFRSHKEYISAEGSEKSIGYFFNFAHKDSDGYRVNNNLEADDVFGSLTMMPADPFEIEFSSAYHRDWYGQPGALYPGNIQSDGTRASRFPNDRAKTEDYYFTAIPRILSSFTAGEWAVSALTSYRSRRTSSVSRGGSNPYEVNHRIDSFEFKPKAEIGLFVPERGVENKFVAGIDCFTATDNVLSGDITLTKQKYAIRKETFGIYASDNLLLGEKILLNGGVRAEWARYIFDQRDPAMSYSTRNLKETAFEVGAGYKYNENSQIYSNCSRSYRYPATDEYFTSAYEFVNWFGAVQLVPAALNTSLKQQVSNNIEIGVKDRTFGKVITDAAYYFVDTRKEIYYDPISYENSNYPRTFRHGFECEFTINIAERLNARAGYNFQKAYFSGGKFAGNEIPLIPRDRAVAGLIAGPWYGMTIEVAAVYTGPRYASSDQANSAGKIKSNVTADSVLSYEIGGLRFFGAVRNLFGKEYFIGGTKDWQGNVAFYPAPERVFEFGVSATF